MPDLTFVTFVENRISLRGSFVDSMRKMFHIYYPLRTIEIFFTLLKLLHNR